jgi:peptidoglycan/xylan/chitin deacetylase (PgdA/CDA1 family)
MAETDALGIEDRPRLTWPGGARVAVWLIPNIEFYEMFPQENAARNPYPRMVAPEFLEYGNIDYGSRVGLYRLLDVLDKHGLPITCSLNMAVPDRLPEIHEAIRERSWEIMSHGMYNTRYHFGLSVDEERQVIQDSIDACWRLFGQRMRGFFAPAGSSTTDTNRLCVELGLDYIPDSGADDQPTRHNPANGNILRIPYSYDINDGMHFRIHHEYRWFIESTLSMFDRLYEDGATTGRVMSVPIHAFWLGHPHRIGALDAILTHMRARSEVWFATGSEIADAYIRQETGGA